MIGPLGTRARPHPWWTPVRLLLAVAVVLMVVCVAQKAPCAVGGSKAAWWSSPHQYAKLCASDLPTAYASGGLAEGVFPLSTSDGRFAVSTDTAPTAVLAYAASTVARALHGWPDTAVRAGQPVEQVARSTRVRTEAVTYVAVSAVVQVLALLVALLALARVVARHGGDPYRRLVPMAASPLLVLAGLVGWDLVPVALTCTAIAAWDRRRDTAAGVLLGLGVASAIWPLALVVPLLGTFIGTDRERAAWRTAGTVLVTWVVIAVPAFVLSGGNSTEFLSTFFERAAGEGSLWRVLQTGALLPSADVSSIVVLGAWALMAMAAFTYAATLRDPRRLAAIAFALLIGVLVVAKSYEPGFALWLLPLAVLAHRNRRDLAVWQGAELFFVVALWWHLGNYTLGLDGHDFVYPVAIITRVAAELWLAQRVLTSPTTRSVDPDDVERRGREADVDLHPVTDLRRRH